MKKIFQKNKLFERICNKYHFTKSKWRFVKLVEITGIQGSLINTYCHSSNKEQIFVNVARDIVNNEKNELYFDEINTYTSYDEACEQIEKILRKYKKLLLEIKKTEIEQDFQ